MKQGTDEVIGLVRDAFSDIAPARPVNSIIEQGRGIRRRKRLTSLAATGVAVVGVLVALGFTLPEDAADRTPISAGVPDRVDVDLAGWSVHTNADSTVTLTVREIHDPDRLREALKQAGVSAAVEAVQITADFHGCKATPGARPLPQVSQVLGDPEVATIGGASVVTIRPSAMPPGSVLRFVLYKHGRGGVAVTVELLSGNPEKCTDK